jgi:hypothetical protein
MMSMPRFSRWLATAAAIPFLALLTSGCLTFSSFQSAKIVDPGKTLSTVSVARNNFLENDHRDPGWTLLEIRNRVGLASSVDAAFKISAARRDENGWVGFLVGGDIRAALWRDHLAVVLPMQVVAGDFDFTTLQVYPGLVGTLPLSDRLEVNASGNIYLFVQAEELSIYTYSLGLGIRPTNGPFRIRPEVGWLRLADPDRLYRQFGLAFEFPIRRKP